LKRYPEEDSKCTPEKSPEDLPVDDLQSTMNLVDQAQVGKTVPPPIISLKSIFPPPPPPLPPSLLQNFSSSSSAPKPSCAIVPPPPPPMGFVSNVIPPPPPKMHLSQGPTIIPPPRPPPLPPGNLNAPAQGPPVVRAPRPPPPPPAQTTNVFPLKEPKQLNLPGKFEKSSGDAISNNKNETVDENDSTPLDQHPQLTKYLKMLKVGLPKDMVGMKMTQDGYNLQLLHCDLTLPRPKNVPLMDPAAKKILTKSVASDANKEGDLGPLVPLADHPIYGKFFKMLKVGLPKPTIESKLGLEGIDASILDLPTTTMLAINDLKYHTLKNATKQASAAGKPEPPKHKKKKLFLKHVDSKNIGQDSLWADDGDGGNIDITVDAEEFNKLFVEDSSEVQRRLQMLEEQKKNQLEKLKRTKRVQLISTKRAQNGAIAFARIKINFDEIKRMIQDIEAESFATEQLKALLEFLPTNEERDSLSKFKGDFQDVGPAERYMLHMMDFEDAATFLQVMIFKQNFYNRWHDCKHKFGLLEATCDQIKSSTRLKKVLKAILKIVNQLHDDPQEKCAGISVDSLLKLSNAKAFDKKTSVLQYVIAVIQRHEQDALLFPEDLKNLSDSAKLTLESINSERTALESELLQYLQALHSVVKKNKQSNKAESAKTKSTINDFEAQLKPMCHELSQRYLKLSAKFSLILRYFGEDPNLKCEGFFVPLNKFVADFIATRTQVEKLRQLELKKLQQQQKKASQLAAKANIDAIMLKNVQKGTKKSDSDTVFPAATEATTVSLHSSSTGPAPGAAPIADSAPVHIPAPPAPKRALGGGIGGSASIALALKQRAEMLGFDQK
jgi:hypothetical protein